METLTRRVSRGALTLEVVEAPDRDLWDFWELWAAGRWEPETFAVLDRHLTPGGLYVDLGAWIGPTVLYAARRCRRVIAVEPDPVAIVQLVQNLRLNDVRNVSVVAGAVDDRRGRAVLHSPGRWGDSMSSLVRGGAGEDVDTWRFTDVVPAGMVDLVKMDIEGAESLVLPDAVGFLEEWRIPCLVSLHEDWWPPGSADPVVAALARFDKVTVLENRAPWPFRTVLCEWE